MKCVHSNGFCKNELELDWTWILRTKKSYIQIHIQIHLVLNFKNGAQIQIHLLLNFEVAIQIEYHQKIWADSKFKIQNSNSMQP